MTSETPRTSRRWILVPLALALMLAAAWLDPAWFEGEATSTAGKVLRFFAHHSFFAVVITLGVISLIELGVCHLLSLGRPVIGETIMEGVVKVLLTVTFFTIFGLTSVFSKMIRANKIPRHNPGDPTYWIERPRTPVDRQTMSRQ